MAATYPFSGLSDSDIQESRRTRNPLARARARLTGSTLLLRLTLLNILAFGLLTAAWWEGLVATVIAADQTYLTVLIFMVFVVGMVIAAWRALQINREIDQFPAVFSQAGVSNAGVNDQSMIGGTVSLTTPLTTGSIGAMRMRLSHRIASVRHIANVLVLLGLIGTVLGFIIALSGVNPETASDVEGIAPMVSTLIQGMSTALYTTLVGSILNVWLTANYQMLASGTVELMSRWMERSEQSGASRDLSDDA